MLLLLLELLRIFAVVVVAAAAKYRRHTLGRAGAATEGIGVFIFFEFSLTFLVLAVFSSRTSQQVAFYAPR